MMYHSLSSPDGFAYQRTTLTCKYLASYVLELFIRSNYGLTFCNEKKISKVNFVNIFFLGKLFYVEFT